MAKRGHRKSGPKPTGSTKLSTLSQDALKQARALLEKSGDEPSDELDSSSRGLSDISAWNAQTIQKEGEAPAINLPKRIPWRRRLVGSR